MVKGEPHCLKLMIYCLNFVFYLLKYISIAQNLWQYVGNTDGKKMTLINLSAWFKKIAQSIIWQKIPDITCAVLYVSSGKTKKVGSGKAGRYGDAVFSEDTGEIEILTVPNRRRGSSQNTVSPCLLILISLIPSSHLYICFDEL